MGGVKSLLVGLGRATVEADPVGYEVCIDEETWRSVDEARRRECQLAIQELLDVGVEGWPQRARRLCVSVTEQGCVMSWRDADGRDVHPALVVPRDVLAPHVQAYVDVIRAMERAEEGHGSARLEALDMAKKLAHDDGARALAQCITDSALPLESCRKLFSLLFVLLVDTTRLHGHRGHRPVRG
ncbi:MAG: UPF0262 family protein [Myxococcota bacterium]|nr:UPF0262 family protein [Myxococcota bacterium]MDW8361056.1 UPF0262 family protein [Myxococcales bacterium]